MENDKDIIANHKKMMNKNYYNEDHSTKRNNILKPYYILHKDTPNKIIDLNEFFKIKYDKDSHIYIKKKFINWYGGFIKQYEFIETEKNYYYKNVKDESITKENPFFVLTALIDNGINPILVPVCFNTDQNNRNYIKIVFNNSIKFLINKETKEMKDLSKNYDEEEDDDNTDNENKINENKEEQVYVLTNKIMKEADNELQEINNDKLIEMNNELEIAKMEKKEKLDNEILFKDLLKEKNIKEDGIFEKDIFKLKFDQRYNLIPSLLEKEKLYKEYISELKANSKERKGEMKILKKNINKYKLFLKEKIENNDFDLEMNYIDFYDKYYDNEAVINLPEQQRELIFNETKYKLKELYQNNKEEIKQKYLAFIEKEFPPEKVRLITTLDQIKNVLKLKKEYLSISSKSERNEIIKEYLEKVKNFIKNRNEHIEEKKKEEEEKKKLEEQNKELKVKSKYSNKGLLNKNKEKKESIAKSIPLKYTTIKDLEYNNHILIFKKFLNERIKRRIPYEEAIQKFTKEYGQDAVNNLEEEMLQKIYKVYIGNMVMKQKDEFNQLLNEYIQYNVDIPWGEAQRMMQYDMRYQNIMPSEREGMYREYRDNIYNRVLSQFETLVNEREDLITKDTPLEGYEYNKLLINLRNDPRAQRIERYPDKRDKIIRAKVKELLHKSWEEEKKKKNQLLNRKTERERNAKLYKKWQKGNVIQ